MESSVTVKVKGTSRSHIPASVNLSDYLMHPEWRDLYNRVWDEADYVVPPAENGAFFITTNIVLTPNQVKMKYNFQQNCRTKLAQNKEVEESLRRVYVRLLPILESKVCAHRNGQWGTN